MGNINPYVAAASVLIGGASAYGQQKQDTAQWKLDEAVRNHNNREATKSLLTTINTLEDETRQVREDTISTSIDIQRATAQAKGSILANAGASGTGGGAVDMQLEDVSSQSARALAKTTLNKERRLQQINYAEKSAEAQAVSRMDLMPKQKPDALSYIMGGFGTAASSYSAISGFLD